MTKLFDENDQVTEEAFEEIHSYDRNQFSLFLWSFADAVMNITLSNEITKRMKEKMDNAMLYGLDKVVTKGDI